MLNDDSAFTLSEDQDDYANVPFVKGPAMPFVSVETTCNIHTVKTETCMVANQVVGIVVVHRTGMLKHGNSFVCFL